MGLAVRPRPQAMGQGDRQCLEAIGLQQPRQIVDGAVQFGQLALVVLEGCVPWSGVKAEACDLTEISDQAAAVSAAVG
jgi:hypothetical protein